MYVYAFKMSLRTLDRDMLHHDIIDRAILHDRPLDAPLCQTALQELRAHRGEVFASPYRTRRRKLMFCLLLHAPKLYQAIVRRYGQRA